MKSCIEPSRPTDRRTPRAFTLVEMLVVITIIGILVALASVAVFKGLEAAKKARIKAEVTNVESAMQQFKTNYGDFPPSNFTGDLTSPDHPVRRFMARAFPRIAENDTDCWSKIKNSDNTPLSPAQALCFWLRGFTKDPAYPLTGKGDRTPIIDFDVSRLYMRDLTTHWTATAAAATNEFPVYMPQGCKLPYVYFNSKSYVHHNSNPGSLNNTVVTGLSVVPYLWDSNSDEKFDHLDWDRVPTPLDQKVAVSEEAGMYANPKSFQIIAAGLDNDFGTSAKPLTIQRAPSGTYNFQQSKVYPIGLGYDTSGADDDNLTNFSERPLGDARP